MAYMGIVQLARAADGHGARQGPKPGRWRALGNLYAGRVFAGRSRFSTCAMLVSSTHWPSRSSTKGQSDTERTGTLPTGCKLVIFSPTDALILDLARRVPVTRPQLVNDNLGKRPSRSTRETFPHLFKLNSLQICPRRSRCSSPMASQSSTARGNALGDSSGKVVAVQLPPSRHLSTNGMRLEAEKMTMPRMMHTTMAPHASKAQLLLPPPFFCNRAGPW